MRLKLPHLALALAALIAFPLTAGETRGKAAEKPATPETAAAMKVFVDPATGQMASPKSDPDAARGVSTTAPVESARPLRVEKVTTKAGGKRVNLQGRFMMEMAVTANPDGKIAHTCASTQVSDPNTAAPATEHRHDR